MSATSLTPAKSVTPLRLFSEGARDITPVLLGVIPFSIITGINAVAVGMPPGVAIAFSLFVYAGSSQLVACNLIAGGAPALVVILSAFVVNFRFVMYSATIAPHLEHIPTRLKAIGAYVLTDQAFALAMHRYIDEPDLPKKHWYYLGAAITMALCWQVGAAFGIFIGASVPAAWGLDFTIPLSFLALVAPTVKDRPIAFAAIAAGITAAATGWMPYKIGLILSVIVGIATGLIVEDRLMKASELSITETSNA